MTRVVPPGHLRALAGVSGEVTLEATSLPEVLDALEARYPALNGTPREPVTGRRRAFVRFFVCREDLSHDAS